MKSSTVAMFEIKEQELQRGLKAAAPYAPNFVRQKEVWVVDEAGMLSQVQVSRLERLAINAGAKLVLVGDTKQLQAVEAGKPFEMAQREGLQTAYMTQISRQQTENTRAVVSAITGQDQLAPGETLRRLELVHNARAFQIMVDRGMVQEVKDGDARQAVVDLVTSMSPAERGKTIVITPFNKDRSAINAGVREHMRNAGELKGADQERRALTSKGLTKEEQGHAKYYEPGDVVRFGRSLSTLGVEKGEYATVRGVDSARGVVMLARTGGSPVELDPSRIKSVEVYQQVSRNIAGGDLIRVTRPTETLANGEVGKVLQIKGSVVDLQLDNGERVALDVDKAPHWDHAYASTVHAAQGSTAKRAVMYIPTPEGGEGRNTDRALAGMAKVFNANSMYVGATRPSHELRVVTNDIAKAREAVTAKHEKTSAVEVIRAHKPQTKGLER